MLLGLADALVRRLLLRGGPLIHRLLERLDRAVPARLRRLDVRRGRGRTRRLGPALRAPWVVSRIGIIGRRLIVPVLVGSREQRVDGTRDEVADADADLEAHVGADDL